MATPLSRQELFLLLEKRTQDPALAKAQDAEIWEACGVEAAVLVMDLAGFSRLTKQHGILHFLTIYRRACSIAAPVIADNGGRIVTCEADNVIAKFATPTAAVAAARALVARTAALDASLATDDRVVVCIGIGFGKFLELRDDVYGDEVNMAFKARRGPRGPARDSPHGLGVRAARRRGQRSFTRRTDGGPRG